MSTKVVLETASFADCISKAARVAPGPTGTVEDKSSGILIEIDPANSSVIVKATDIAIFYTEWVDPLLIEGDAVTWHCPSKLLNGFVSSLPIGSGKNLTLSSDGSMLDLVSGRAKAKFNLIEKNGYPKWDPFDEESMSDVPNLGERIKQVEWAASKHEPALGLRITGEYLIGTDRYRLVQVPLKIENFDKPITIPAKVLTGILKNIGDTKIKVANRALFVTPDEHSQARTVVIDLPFPDSALARLSSFVYQETVKVEKEAFVNAVTRCNEIRGKDPFPKMKIILGRSELACYMSDDELGHIGDVIELPGQADHKRCELVVGPNFIKEALSHAPNAVISMSYTPWPIADIAKAPPIMIDGGSGYKVWIMQRAEPAKGSE